MKIDVHGVGPKDATIAIVGEAPGAQEARLKEPFVGPSGKLLKSLLDSAGIIREASCYLTNVVKVQPEGNDITPFIKLGGKEPKESDEYKDYKEYLFEELSSLHELRVVVAVGNVALHALTGMIKVTKRRGSVYEIPLAGLRQNIKLIPIIHPSSILRARGSSDVAQADPYMLNHFTVEDLKKAKDIAEGRWVDIERKYLTRPSLGTVLLFLADKQIAKKPIAFDIETSRITNELLSIAIGNCSEKALCIPFKDFHGDYFTEWNEVLVMSAISRLLEDPEIPKIAHNAAFDCGFLLRKYGIKATPVTDTMLAHKVLCPDFPKSLEFVASMLAKMPYWKDEGKDGYAEAGKVYDTLWKYNCKDVMVLHEILPMELSLLESQGNLTTFTNQNALLEPLLYMQARGICIDKVGLDRIITETQEELDELGEQFQASIYSRTNNIELEINPHSSKQLADYFYGTLGIKPYTHRKTKNPTTDTTALKRLARRGYKEASILLDIRKQKKLNTTCAGISLCSDGRLRSLMSPLASTGRLTSSKLLDGNGTNMENLPPQISKLLHADEGYIAFSFDLSNSDNRSVAYIAPEPIMIKAFEQGIDIHSQTYALMYSIPIEAVSREPNSSPIGNGEESQRFWGKKTNHSFNYGLGYVNYSLDAEIEQSEGKNHHDKYHAIYPGLKGSYFRWVEEDVRRTRKLTNSYGRVRRFLGRMDHHLILQALAFIPQSNTADTINIRGLQFIYEHQNLFRWVELLNQVHDSIWFQIPKHIGFPAMTEILTRIKESLETPLVWKENSFSIPAELKAGHCFGKLWDTTPKTLEEDYERNRIQ